MLAKDTFYGALAEFVRERGYDVAEVTLFEEETVASGFCETCYYESTEVHIYYLNSDGVGRRYEYYGNMAELIRELTD